MSRMTARCPWWAVLLSSEISSIAAVAGAAAALRDAEIAKALAPKEPALPLTESEQSEAMELLRYPQLLDRIVEDLARCGVVGEETNKLVGYLGVVSRHLDAPLAVIVQSSSAAGKSSLMELAFVPEEQRVQYSAITGQSLFYMGKADLKHKVLAIAEEVGAHSATYALKLLQSEGVLSIASTGKDPATGRMVTHQYRVEGPVMIFLTTTAIDIDEELLNSCLVLTVNEDREQTQAIHRIQREAQTIEGLLRKKDREDLLRVHRNAQRLLKPVFVANPYARELTFLDSLLTSAYMQCWCQVALSLLLPSRSVSVKPSSSSRCVMWETRSLAVSKVCGKSGTASSFHAFHQTVISTAARERVFSTKSGP